LTVALRRTAAYFQGDRSAFVWRKIMSVRALLAAIAVVSVPIAVNGAEPQTQATPDPQAKRTCTVRYEIGSRLNRVRTCRTAAERETAKQEQRQVIDRIQNDKVSFGK
jgi:hypothetical protein